MTNNGIAFVENESHDSGGSSDGEMEVEEANSLQVVTSNTTGPLLPRDTPAVGMFMHVCNDIIGYYFNRLNCSGTLRHGSTISRTSAVSAHEYHLHLI